MSVLTPSRSSAAGQMTIAVLGAGGFIGSHLIEHLMAQNRYSVLGVDVSSEKLADIVGPGFTFYRADVQHAPDVLERVIQEAHLVVDLLAYATPSMYVTDPLEVFNLNVVQNLEVAKLCIRYRKRLIQYSWAEVYGKGEGGTSSKGLSDGVVGPVHGPGCIYSTGKMLLERVLYAHGIARNLEFTILRPLNFIGSRIDLVVPAHADGGSRVFSHFMSALLSGGPLRLVDGDHAHHSFMHIDDANSAFQTILDHPVETRNQIYNVGNPANDLTTREVAALMMDLYEELTGHRPSSEVIHVTQNDFYRPGYEASSRLPPDISKLQSLGCAPRHDVRPTLRDAMRYYIKSLSGTVLGNGRIQAVDNGRADPVVGAIPESSSLPKG